jgi:hypothetical protein
MDEDFEWPDPPKGDASDGSVSTKSEGRPIFGKNSHASLRPKKTEEEKE